MIKVSVMQTGPLDVNTYIVHDENSKECVVIDPADGAFILKYLEENDLSCTHIFLTHGHFDHIMGVAYLKNKTQAQIYVHEKDATALTNDKHNLGVFVHVTVEKCEPDVLLHDGDVISAAGITFNVLHTPGHSRGSVCYIVEADKVIFSGDTLFHLSVGRCDLMYSKKTDLAFSILYKLYPLSGDYTVLPGHGERTSLQFERDNNPVTQHMECD